MLAGLGLGARPALAGTDVCRFEVLHAAPDLALVDVYINATLLVSGLSYTQFSKRYVVKVGGYSIRVVAQGGSAAGPFLLDFPVSFDANQRYLIAVTGRAQQIEGVSFLEPAAPPAGQALLRFIHLDPGQGGIDVVNPDLGAALVIGNTAYKEAKTQGFAQGSYPLQLRQTGTANVLATLASTNFPEQKVSTLIRFFAPAAQAARARVVGEPEPRPLVIKRSK